MMNAELPIHATPIWFMLLLFIGGGLLVGMAMGWRSRRRRVAAVPPVKQARSYWIPVTAGAGLTLFLVLGSTSVVPHRVTTVSGEPSLAGQPPSESHGLAASDAYSDAHVELRPELRPRQETVPVEPVINLASVGTLAVALLTLIAGIAIYWAKAINARTRADASREVPKSGLGWLTVPAVCLTALVIIAAPILVPVMPTTFHDRPVISAVQQERMDKIVEDLVRTASSPGDEVQNIPDWIKQKPTASHVRLLSSGPYTTRQEAEDEILPIAANLLQRAFHENHPWQGEWNVPLAQVRERVVEQEFLEQRSKTYGKYNGPMYRVHMLVKTSPEVCETFTDSWKSQIVQRRLKIFGVLLAWLSCVFLMGSAYFRSLATPGMGHRMVSTLKASVLTVGVTVLAGWVLLTFIR